MIRDLAYLFVTLTKYHIKSILLADIDKIIKTQWKLEPTPLATCYSIDTMHRKNAMQSESKIAVGTIMLLQDCTAWKGISMAIENNLTNWKM